MKKTITLLVILAGTITILAAPVNLGNIGTGDYRAYWSASYLLRHGEAFANGEQLYRIEHELTGFGESYPGMTWNPPWLLVMLEPYTLFAFGRAVWLWFLTNLVLAFAAIALLWRHMAIDNSTQRWIPVAALLFIVFPPTLVSLMSGQVNFLVLFGLAVFVVQSDLGREWSAGAALALTMTKPHLVYITVPLVLLQCIRCKRVRVLLGFLVVLVSLTAIAFLQRPTFISDYVATAIGGNLLDYQTPTLGGWLDALMGWRWAKLIGLAVLPSAILVWLSHPVREMSRLVESTLFLSVITSPFGWSYDHIVLIIPLIHVVIDLIEGGLPRAYSLVWTVLLIQVDVALFWVRTIARNDVLFFWVPPVIFAIYLIIGWQIIRKKTTRLAKKEVEYQN